MREVVLGGGEGGLVGESDIKVEPEEGGRTGGGALRRNVKNTYIRIHMYTCTFISDIHVYTVMYICTIIFTVDTEVLYASCSCRAC